MPVPKGYPMPHPEEDKLPERDALSHIYWEEEQSQDKIASKFNVGRWTVSRKMARLGIPVRTFNESQKLAGRSKMGAGNVNWKGIERKLKRGYVYIYSPYHPRACQGYVLEHIMVWETNNGRPLPIGWVIHHLNGIKDDNRPSNLVGLPSREHSLILALKAKRIQELEAIIKGQGFLI